MNYNELATRDKQIINGLLSAYSDKIIRRKIIWSPIQMYSEFMEYLKMWGLNEPEKHNLKKWLNSDSAKPHILLFFEKKINKYNILSVKKPPVVENIIFGLDWDNDLYFNINYDIYKKAHDLQSDNVTPYSIEHVERELQKYSIDLKTTLSKLSRSPIEIKFYNEWFKRYYSNKNNPALIPEFCGSPYPYYCYKHEGTYVLNRKSYKDKYVKVRYDFAIINNEKQKKLLIELDGHDHHSALDDRVNDSVKRIIATKNGWQLNVITGSQITRNIDDVFDSMSNFFEVN